MRVKGRYLALSITDDRKIRDFNRQVRPRITNSEYCLDISLTGEL